MSQKKQPRKASSTPPAKSVPRRRWLRTGLGITLAGSVLLGVWLVYLDAQVRQAFDGRKWALPAKVYARPLALYPGLLLSPQQLESELKWADYRAAADAGRPGTYSHQGGEWQINRRAFPFWDGQESARQIRLSLVDGRIARLADAQGEQPLIRLEPQYVGGIFPTHNEDRELIRLEDVPPVLVAALIVTEDKSFFSHWGISVTGIARAMLANIRAGGMVQGGSTLTQQLVKNFFLTNERTLTRKVQEAFMSLLLELHYSKEEILEAYINEVYLGQSGRRAIHGFGLGARFYFGKPLQELSTGEIATLVGLVKGASFYNPRRHPQRAESRRDLILGVMQDNRIISAAERIRAAGQPLVTAEPRREGQREYPAFLELAKQQLQQDYRLEDLQNEGLRVFTTLDPWVQYSLEKASVAHLQQLEAGHPDLTNKLETAAVITSVDGGEIRALLGSRHVTYFGFNRALDARRPIGSLVKPMVYLTALKEGEYHWGSRVDDGPVTVEGPQGKLWQPRNYDEQSHGEVPLLDGLKRSLNQATARLGMTVGIDRVVTELHRAGVLSEVPSYPSILLGAIDLSPLEVAQMYQTLASTGFLTPLRSIDAVTTSGGETLSSYAIRGRQVYDPALMEWLRYGLEQVVADGTARAVGRALPQPLAGKTGTSDDIRDAWYAGFDNRHLGVIWVGRDDNQPMAYPGSRGALPIWLQTFRDIGTEPLPPTRDLVQIAVNEQGALMPDGCRAGTPYPFPKSWLDKERVACDADGAPIKERIRSWLDWLF
tara:strand:+ start:98391 stop:100706 length:2316 start_codon:yes stop_codon:yes gene_type:complete